jgi:hypothetical protein
MKKCKIINAKTCHPVTSCHPSFQKEGKFSDDSPPSWKEEYPS